MAQSIPQSPPRMVDRGLAALLAASPLGLDSLLLLATLFPMTAHWDGYRLSYSRVLPIEAISLFAVLAYLLGATYITLDYFGRARETTTARQVVLGLLVVNLVVAPMVTSMVVRHVTGQTERWAHDTPLQIEAAVDALLHGRNPYATDYTDAPLARWPYYNGPLWSSNWREPAPPEARVNPAIYHVAYLPFTLLVAVPVQLLSTATLGWFDGRWTNLLAYLFTLWLLTRLVRERVPRLAALILVGLNPLLVPYVVEGRNDILVFSLLLAAVVAWQEERPLASAVWLGLALATKHVAALFLPFYLLLLWRECAPHRNRLSQLGRRLLPTLVTALALTAPFILWDWSAFFEDTVGYVSGLLPTSYPLSGMGLGGIVVAVGLVPNAAAPFSASLLQVLIAGPLLVALLRYQWRFNTLRYALGGYAVFLLVFMWLARFYFENYLGYILLVLATAVVCPADDTCARPSFGLLYLEPDVSLNK
ncbi:MAG: DUF2029 domain-containing protein [Anaerolineae bacterium]|nr:DUF2029 domain-containing protein [Anaerolineae bacterium]